MMNGSEPRVSHRIKYILNKIQSMVPDALQQSLFILLTNVDLKPNLNISQVLDFKIDQKRIFSYNNQIFQLTP
jgi:hypothetical protein